MQVKDYEVYDRNGKLATRPNGILQAGDTMRVKMNLMDGMSNPALADAAARAEAQRRIEAFDARQHRPGFVSTQDAYDAGDKLREARDARLRDSWRNPPSVTTNTATALEQVAVVGRDAPDAQLFAARDAVLAARDRAIADRWRQP
jgi:hypothetical protein